MVAPRFTLSLTSLRAARAVAMAAPVLLGACALVGSHSRNPLHAAGFADRPADTPARQAMLMRLPPHRFVLHTHGSSVAFVYADPGGCDCLYVGSGRALQRYRRRTGDRRDAIQDYQDYHWDWNAWNGFSPAFQWGPGMGWSG